MFVSIKLQFNQTSDFRGTENPEYFPSDKNIYDLWSDFYVSYSTNYRSLLFLFQPGTKS